MAPARLAFFKELNHSFILSDIFWGCICQRDFIFLLVEHNNWTIPSFTLLICLEGSGNFLLGSNLYFFPSGRRVPGGEPNHFQNTPITISLSSMGNFSRINVLGSPMPGGTSSHPIAVDTGTDELDCTCDLII